MRLQRGRSTCFPSVSSPLGAGRISLDGGHWPSTSGDGWITKTNVMQRRWLLEGNANPLCVLPSPHGISIESPHFISTTRQRHPFLRTTALLPPNTPFRSRSETLALVRGAPAHPAARRCNRPILILVLELDRNKAPILTGNSLLTFASPDRPPS